MDPTQTKVHALTWVNAKLDYVRAELTDSNKPLPRIPPRIRARAVHLVQDPQP
jgi:hypothetical protein